MVHGSLQYNQVNYAHELVTNDIDKICYKFRMQESKCCYNLYIYNPPHGTTGRKDIFYNILNNLSDKFRHYCIIGD